MQDYEKLGVFYLGREYDLNNKKLQGVCYIGSRPTLGISQEKNIEAHIFDFKKSLYGKNLELYLKNGMNN